MTPQQAGFEAELASRREDWPEWRRLMDIANSEMKWQPIETAPKDGTILIYLPKMKNVVSGRRSVNGGWCDCWCSRLEGSYEPSHWMPLPEPPIN